MYRRQHPEQALQRAVLEHLAWRGAAGLFAFHCPNGGWRSGIEAKIFKSLGVVAGVPDVILIHGGRVFGLELKAEGGRLSPIQIATQARMRAAGAIVATAAGLDAALDQLTAWGLLRPDVSSQIATAFTGLRDDVARRTARLPPLHESKPE
jgi:hypothetical protein